MGLFYTRMLCPPSVAGICISNTTGLHTWRFVFNWSCLDLMTFKTAGWYRLWIVKGVAVKWWIKVSFCCQCFSVTQHGRKTLLFTCWRWAVCTGAVKSLGSSSMSASLMSILADYMPQDTYQSMMVPDLNLFTLFHCITNRVALSSSCRKPPEKQTRFSQMSWMWLCWPTRAWRTSCSNTEWTRGRLWVSAHVSIKTAAGSRG